MAQPSSSSRQSIDADALATVRAALAAQLRQDHQQSESFIADAAEEMVDQAFIEYAEARERGEVIASPVGFLIATAVRRSIDRMRSEGHELHGEGAEAIIEGTEDQAPATEAVAVLEVEAEELHEAVRHLPREQRQALALYYWEGLSTRKAAVEMGLSHGTFCRRRDAALNLLRERLGAG
ncbi:MAG TPA: sigma-70 family RNA polymerase sigma factor [Solirubrobacterales bacterium]|nr:sigma-70 family RNA polymerase sigma factor [Solirubrobacterales bacterium]